MQTITTIAELRASLRDVRGRGARVALVPTMGALHAGHLALVDAVRTRETCVVMSVFVNRLQFGPREDFAAYPRDLGRDAALAGGWGVDILFAPAESEIYPTPPIVAVTPIAPGPGEEAPDARWEGAARPGHFTGVLTVVAKLLNIIEPDAAAFGRKDLQQVTLLRALVRDLNLAVDLVVVPTVRDPDGLALSSRNVYLSADERAQARVIPQALSEMVASWTHRTVTDAAELTGIGRRMLQSAPAVQVEYLAVVEPQELKPVTRVESGAVVLVAARVGSTRLIDNAEFAPPSEPR